MSKLWIALQIFGVGFLEHLPSSAFAETGTALPTVFVNATATETAAYANSLTSTATRTPTNTLAIPYSVGSISNSLLQDSQAMRLEDAAQFISGVQPSSQDSGLDTDLSIRGYSTAGSTYLNGLLDNLDFQVRDLALIDRIEILKGQSSVLYGAGNPGGVVNYISKQPLATTQHKVSLTGGNYDFGRLVLDSTGPVNQNPNLLYRVIATGQLAHEFRAQVVNNKATLAPSLTFKYAPDALLKVDFEYSYQNQPFRFDNVYTQNRVVFDQSYVDPRAQSDRDYWRLSSALQHPLSKQWSLHLSSHYFHVERHDLLIGSYTFINPTTLSGYYRDLHDHYDQFSFRSELQGRLSSFGHPHHLLIGTEYTRLAARINSLRSINGFHLDVYRPSFDYALPSNNKPLNSDRDSHELGFYVHDQLDYGQYWHITGGLRYSLFEITQNQKLLTEQHALSFNAGLSVTPTANLAGYFGFSQSFKPNSGMTKQADFLPAKRGELLEVGIKTTTQDQRLRANLAIYQLQQSNLTTRDPSDPDFVVSNGKLRSQGLELDVQGRLTEAWEVVANYTWLSAKFLQHDSYQGNTFRSSPKHSGSLWVKYTLPISQLPGKLNWGAGAFLVDQRQGDDANSFSVPGYVRADMFVSYRQQALELQFKFENLLDKRYVSSSNFDDTVIQGNRFLFRATATLSFG